VLFVPCLISALDMLQTGAGTVFYMFADDDTPDTATGTK
jgi:hypothetical protein